MTPCGDEKLNGSLKLSSLTGSLVRGFINYTV